MAATVAMEPEELEESSFFNLLILFNGGKGELDEETDGREVVEAEEGEAVGSTASM